MAVEPERHTLARPQHHQLEAALLDARHLPDGVGVSVAGITTRLRWIHGGVSVACLQKTRGRVVDTGLWSQLHPASLGAPLSVLNPAMRWYAEREGVALAGPHAGLSIEGHL